jgi:hypothetical protein
MMCAMSDGTDRPTGGSHDGDGPGVLANLPRTRPQRASPRRAAAREAARASSKPKRGAGSAEVKQQAAKRGKRTAGTRRRPLRPAPTLDPVPSQGYEAEDDAATGPVQPPGGTELLLSAAEIVGELAKAGLSRSERLVKDALSRLPLS